MFEGSHANTFDKLRKNQKKYGPPTSFGHDVPESGRGVPSFIEDFYSVETPWFTLMGKGTSFSGNVHLGCGACWPHC